MIWWHRHRGHRVQARKVSVGLGDSSKGLLYRCECGKVWAK